MTSEHRIDALIADLQPGQILRPITVTALQAICPTCGKPRSWKRMACSRKCGHKLWERDNRERRNEYRRPRTRAWKLRRRFKNAANAAEVEVNL